ncbi:probable phospholipid-transporting ATPase IM isoform X9 [Dermochelys coriacea]|uniref:probable phospholipid-transporting ATPase IM isoform X9 n=1 Tax=Dermochelys coriacea TaxID=27794 RepID=UPI001CA99FFB|nr:probable phospholipid-transporting ATPase IM isoform X9 [Dermochelys coriacea]
MCKCWLPSKWYHLSAVMNDDEGDGHQEEERRVKANDPEHNEKFQYANNRIKTSKYNILTFLPVNLFEQFQRVANAYFLSLLILQFRHKSDNQVNNRQAEVLIGGRLQNEKWMNVRPGDVIKLENNTFVAADVLLLSSSEPHGLCYIETAELDGETNLKVHQALPDTSELGADIRRLAEFDGVVVCEPPNNKLDTFTGVLFWKDNRYSLNNEKMLLRGCVLRNTEWCFGMVIFAGPDTKLMQNSGRTKFKRTSIDRLMNTLVLWIFGFLVCMGIILAVGNSIWEHQVGAHFRIYLYWNEVVNSSVFSGFLTFWSYIIILNSVVPISLYVSVEVIRLGHSYFINWDRKMYYPKKDTPAEVRTTTLNEELGQIEYIFSDKTGTITQNIMTFNKCSINGKAYGDVYDDFGRKTGINEKTVPVDFSFNPLADRKFQFYDHSLIESIKLGDAMVHEFFRLLSLCHTVMPEEKNAVQSPDGQIKLYCKGADTILFERLHPSNEELMSLTSDHLEEFAGEGLRTLALAYKNLTEEHFKEWFKILQEANTSLDSRNEYLAAAYEEIEKDMMLLGATAIEDKLQEGVTETIASLSLANIKIWVLTGDKQETAMNIGYSCHMLTDTMNEIFVVAGHTVKEVREELRKAKEHLFGQNKDLSNGHVFCEKMQESKQGSVLEETVTGDYALVINGHSLAHALEADLENEFVEVACLCKTVICCRVTPLQKAQVVELVKKHRKAVTLAIGDGANDISMIKSAHIGIGISGEEGMQAVLASDYSFAQFRYLKRLLLVHGRWSYFRMCKFLCYFFYKNFAFTLVHFWFGFFCGFSAQTVYDQWFITLFNIVYTSLPVLGMGLFDQDVNEQNSMDYAKLYEPGQLNLLFNKRKFFICVAHGIYTSFALFFIPYGAFYNTAGEDGKHIADYQSFAVTVATSLVIVVSVQIVLDTSYWTAINRFFILGSIAVYFAILFAMHSDGIFVIFPNHFPFVGNSRNSLGQISVWLVILLTTVISVMPVITFRFLKEDLNPTQTDQVRKLQKVRRKQKPLQNYMRRVYRTQEDLHMLFLIKRALGNL